jgi:hypothetical protein
MKTPEGHINTMGCVKLLKTLYGLKQSPREWNNVLDCYLREQGFSPSDADPCIYMRTVNGNMVVIAVYVDDIIIACKQQAVIDAIRSVMKKRFKMDDIGPLTWYLGINIAQMPNGDIEIDQDKYISDKLAEFGIAKRVMSSPLVKNFQDLLLDANDEQEPGFPYRSAVGSLMFAMVATRPDICAAVGVVCRFLEKPKKVHCDMVRQIFYYLNGNYQHIRYKSSADLIIRGWCDASYANSDDYKSIQGYGFTMAGALISWNSQKQSVVAKSTCEAELIAVDSFSNETIWLKRLAKSLNIPQKTITCYEDNQACIALSNNPHAGHKRTKHIQVRWFDFVDKISAGEFCLEYCTTKSQLADIFTKGFNGTIFRGVLTRLGLVAHSRKHTTEIGRQLDEIS